MKENFSLITASMIKGITLVVIFVTPLLFMPWTFDAYEFPKQVFIWIAAATLLVLWLLHFVVTKEVKIIKTPIDLPLILFIVVGLISMLLASSRYISLVGFFGRPDNGFASIVAYAIIFYVASSTMNTLKDAIHALITVIASCTVLALFGALTYFGIHLLSWQGSHTNTFSPAGGMFALTTLLVMALPVSLGLLLYGNRTVTESAVTDSTIDTPKRTLAIQQAVMTSPILAIAAFLCLAAIALLGNLSAWIGLLVAIVIFFLWSKRGDIKASLPYIMALVIASILWLGIAVIPQVRNSIPGFNQKIDRPQVLSVNESWNIAVGGLRDLPFFGSGPATYLYDFTRYHSQAYNLADSWTLRYLVAHDQYLQILSTLGILGFAAYMFMVVRILLFGFRTVLRNRDVIGYPVKVGVFAALCAYLAATLFIVPTTTVVFLFFVLLAILMSLEKLSGNQIVGDRRIAFVLTTPGQTTYTTTPNNVVPMLLFIPGLLLAVVIFFASVQYVRANVSYVKGVKILATGKANTAQQGLIDQAQAATINPWEDGYHRDLARTSFNIALLISQKQSLTDADKKNVQDLLTTSISQAQRATSLAPLDANNWQTLADIYRNIATQVQGAGDASLQAFARAIQVDPNPQLFVDVGGLYFAANSYDRAIDAFRQAVQLKPNYANAWYNLANAYVKKNDYNNAYLAYQGAKQYTQQLPDSDPGKKNSLALLDKEMAAIADKVSTPSASTSTSGQQPQASSAPGANATVTPATTTTTRKASPSVSPKAAVQ